MVALTVPPPHCGQATAFHRLLRTIFATFYNDLKSLNQRSWGPNQGPLPAFESKHRLCHGPLALSLSKGPANAC